MKRFAVTGLLLCLSIGFFVPAAGALTWADYIALYAQKQPQSPPATVTTPSNQTPTPASPPAATPPASGSGTMTWADYVASLSRGQTPNPPDSGTSPPTQTVPTASESQLVDLINRSRQEAGLRPVVFDAKLGRIARLKAEDMVKNNYFDHVSPTYGTLGQMLGSFGVSYRGAGECLALAPDVWRAHQQLLGSAPHRQIILTSGYDRVGVAVVPKGSSVLVVEIFVQS